MNENTCVCCGVPIPEGRQVCWNCEYGYGGTKNDK
jgi:predicted nucleic acid-binding Zn ribbon protein